MFDVKSQILSLLHDDNIMCEDNFAKAKGLNIFTGIVHDDYEPNNRYGEIHTGDAWNSAREKFCGKDGNYMPFGMVVFADKSHTSLHGALLVTPITFTATFLNRKVRNNPKFWRPIAYLPNLGYGKDTYRASHDKLQDEHNCLAFALKSLVELSDAGGI
jgi:hypothetical protein